MNINDRRRASNLIEQELDAQIRSIKQEPTNEEVKQEEQAILKRTGLLAKVNQLQKVNESKGALERELSESLQALRGKSRRKRRGYGCECDDHYEEILTSLATENVTKTLDAGKKREALIKQRRKLLARVEIADSVDDLRKILKEAGLV